MSSSFEKINYNLRPNKCVERKMMCEALARLTFIDNLNQYRYIGFGSPYFADFSLMHKSLGITNLISIEKEEAKKNRFEFNIPYSGITMHYGLSSTVLPNLELDKVKNIVWLDYDDRITDYMFGDIDSFFVNAMPGSFFIISVNVEEEFMMPKDFEEDEEKISLKQFRLNSLIDRVGKARLPNEFMELNMTTKNLSRTTYEMVNRRIISSLINRNGNNQDKVNYEQVFNFLYKDNATILTIGGIIYNQAQKTSVAKMAFQNLPFVSLTDESYKIQCPNLTLREIKALDKALPDDLTFDRGKFKSKKLQSIPLTPTDIKNYASIYRYYPNFTDVAI